jgi:hypothetical protein
MFSFDWFNRKKLRQLAKSLAEVTDMHVRTQLSELALRKELDELNHANLQSSLHYTNEIKTLREQLITAEHILKTNKRFYVQVWGAEELPNKVQRFGYYWKDLAELAARSSETNIHIFMNQLGDENKVIAVPARYIESNENSITIGDTSLGTKPSKSDTQEKTERPKSTVKSFEKRFPKRKK